MSYEPLHHKYRPQTFADLVGQEAIATTLTNAIQTARIAPAYLFTGPRGTGKTSSARILAKSLNCQATAVPTAQPCGECSVCRAIASGAALDVIEIDAASNTGVDNIREIIDRAQFAPVQCRHKVYIIDECHMLSSAAFNALLKTLEEPPAHVVFVLATTDPQRVLPTIISRCQKFDFRRIPLEAMVQHLKHIAKQETIDITDEAITLVAQIAQGGLRDAESLLDQLSLLTGSVSVDRVWDLVGAVPERDLLELIQAIEKNDPERVLELARHLMDRGREPLIVLQNLASFYRDLLIAKTASSRQDLVALTAPTWSTLCELAVNWEINRILAAQTHLKNSEVQIKNTTQPRLWLEITLLGLLPSAVSQPVQAAVNVVRPTFEHQQPAAPPPVVPQKPHLQIVPPPPAREQKHQEEVPPTAKPQEPLQVETPPVAEPAPPEQTQIDVGQLWQQVLEHLIPATKALFRQQGQLLEVNEHRARISLPNETLLSMAQRKQPEIEEAFAKVLHRAVKIYLQIANSKQSQPAKAIISDSPPLKTTQVDSPRAPESPEPTKGVATVIPPQEPTKLDWDIDEVTKAARNLAQFFNGEVIPMTDDIEFVAFGAMSDLELIPDLALDFEEEKDDE